MKHQENASIKSVCAGIVVFLACFSLLAVNPQNADAGGAYEKPGDHSLTLFVDGLERTYNVHVPSAYNRKTHLPLVIMLHGGGSTARAAIWETEWAVKADKEGFLVAFPNAMARSPSGPSSFSDNPQLWNDGSDRFYAGQRAPDDVGFISAMLDDLSARFALDKQRIFVAGFSNGASMSFRAGVQLSHRIAAIAAVAGALWVDPPIFMHPVSLCYITGTADPLNPIEGGVPRLATGASDKVRAKPKPPVRTSILKWVRALGGDPKATSVSYVRGVLTETYLGLNVGEVTCITVDKLGHTWPGGRSLLPESMVGAKSSRIRANDVIWDFFQKHARPVPEKIDGGGALKRSQ